LSNHILQGKDESPKAYRIRLYRNKDAYGLNNVEIGKLCNEAFGVDYDESAHRKKVKSYLTGYDDGYKDAVKDNESNSSSKQIEHTLEQIRKERKKLQTLNVERNRIDREEARQELFYEYVSNMITALPLPKFEVIQPMESEKEYLLTIADVHYGALYESLNNSYSPEIARVRFEVLTGEVVKFISEKKITHLNIASLGDEVQGILRCTDLKLNQSTVVQSIVEICRIISLFLNEISKYVTIDYYCVPTSNHTQLRPLGTKANEIASEDYCYLIGQYITDLCSNNSRITIHTERKDEFVRIYIQNHTIYACHGHQFGGTNNPIQELNMVFGEQINYLFLGHLHNRGVKCEGESIMSDIETHIVPSFCGSDPYANHIRKGSKASCMIYGFDRNRGMNETYKIILN